MPSISKFHCSSIIMLRQIRIWNYNKQSGNLRTRWTSSKPLTDGFERRHNYLRISLTEKCNLRCRYCMPEEGVQLSKKVDCLNLNELKRLADIFVQECGIDKIRLTGGEPTIDKKLIPLLEYLDTLREAGLKTVAMTTNGMNLSKSIGLYQSVGLDAINISLDTLKKEKFELLTRRKGWDQVYRGLLAAVESQSMIIKLNCVIMKGINDEEIYDFAELARRLPIEVRFIEFMPFAGNKWEHDKMLPYNQIMELLKIRYPSLEKVSGDKVDVSKVYKDPSMMGCIGFISSMTDNFCDGCNRLRLTSDGNLKVCLFGKEETSLITLIRNGSSNKEIVEAIKSALKNKWRRHLGASSLQAETSRPMVKIGMRLFHSSSKGGSFSHLNEKGEVSMVNVNRKKLMNRVAVARGKIEVGSEVLEKIHKNTMKKGDIISVAKIAGILGAKMTNQLIPLCHQVPLDHVDIQIRECEKTNSLVVTALAEATYNTGVEMESLVAVSVALLTIYDMCKSLSKSMMISEVKLVSKIESLIHPFGAQRILSKEIHSQLSTWHVSLANSKQFRPFRVKHPLEDCQRYNYWHG